MGRITKRFAQLKADKRAGLVAYISAGDPDAAIGYADPEGPAGRRRRPDRARHALHRSDGRRSVDPAAGQRALKAGITVDATFDMVRRFRKETGDDARPSC